MLDIGQRFRAANHRHIRVRDNESNFKDKKLHMRYMKVVLVQWFYLQIMSYYVCITGCSCMMISIIGWMTDTVWLVCQQTTVVFQSDINASALALVVNTSCSFMFDPSAGRIFFFYTLGFSFSFVSILDIVGLFLSGNFHT